MRLYFRYLLCELLASGHLCCMTYSLPQVQIQAYIDADHVVKIRDTILLPEAKQLVIIMEYCEGGNLREWIRRNRKHGTLSETVILQMLQEICKAVYTCHQQRVIHRDLKPENVLLDGRRRVKLGTGVVHVLPLLLEPCFEL